MSDGALIVPRRNFLIRALGFTAMGASVPVPVLALDTPESRLEHHTEGVLRELAVKYPDYKVSIMRNVLMHNRPVYFGHFGVPLSFSIEHREKSEKMREYNRAKRELDERFGMSS